MSRARHLLLAALLALAPLPAATAADRLVAFGDSLTEGVGDTQSPPGYPPKLKKLLLSLYDRLRLFNKVFVVLDLGLHDTD